MQQEGVAADDLERVRTKENVYDDQEVVTRFQILFGVGHLPVDRGDGHWPVMMNDLRLEVPMVLSLAMIHFGLLEAAFSLG